MNQELVTIIIPCYSQAQYLDESLQSVLDQSYRNWECIIINDGSPDNTAVVAKDWLLKDNRFKYFYKENEGLSSARNTGIENALGEFILPLDADDKISKDYVKLAIEAFRENPNIKVVYCKAEKFGIENGLWNLEHYSLKSLALYNMIFCSALFKKDDWVQVGGYDVKMRYGLEDWEFWIALLKNGGTVKKIKHIGFFYRIKEQSMIRELDDMKRNELFKYMSVKHADFFVDQLGSFHSLNQDIKNVQRKNDKKLKSKKFVLDLFCKTFFGFGMFSSYKQNR